MVIQKETRMNAYFIDRFNDPKPAGKVIGTQTDGTLRKGIDIEGQIGIDHGALRIQPLYHPGWGRAGIAYGPYTRENGLTLGFHVLNGHNASHTGDLSEGRISRLKNWIKGSETESIPRRLMNWLRAGDKRRTLRYLISWYLIQRESKTGLQPPMDENLALGWFGDDVPQNPTRDNNALFVRSLGPENGALLAQVSSQDMTCVRGLQNIPIYVIIILREVGAAYYAASIPGAGGLVPYPLMRPIAIDSASIQPEVYAGLHQSVSGQIGFRADTRVYSVQVNKLPQYGSWFGTAHTADRLTGSGQLDASPCETRVIWQVERGSFKRTSRGIQPVDEENIALIHPTEPSGLIHFIIDSGLSTGGQVGLIWRYQNANNHLELVLSQQEVQLLTRTEGNLTRSVYSLDPLQFETGQNAVQIVDNSNRITCTLNGRIVCETDVDPALPDSPTIGFRVRQSSRDLYLHSFEAHPKNLPIPSELKFGAPPDLTGEQEVIFDDFAGHLGQTLQGKATTTGGVSWQKQIGNGTIELAADSGARVRGDVHHPNPGRTIYTLPWDNSSFADLSLVIQAPGSGRNQGEKGRAGVVFWQDPDHYVIVNTWLDDYAEGASISSFFRIKGFEEIYDAIWTNIGTRISWGQTYTLRVSFDGNHYIAYVNDEAVLYRALTDVYPSIQPINITQVGIVANWEWGNDTGSWFLQFEAKDFLYNKHGRVGGYAKP